MITIFGYDVDVEKVMQGVIAVLLATTGGLARLLSKKDRTRLRWGLIFSELFVSGFAGLMTLLLARASGLTGDWVGLVCGIAGWTSPMILFAISRITERLLKIQENDLGKSIKKGGK